MQGRLPAHAAAKYQADQAGAEGERYRADRVTASGRPVRLQGAAISCDRVRSMTSQLKRSHWPTVLTSGPLDETAGLAAAAIGLDAPGQAVLSVQARRPAGRAVGVRQVPA